MMKCALLISFAALLCRLSAVPVTVVYEGFEYLEGGALAGGATGTGWAGAWAGAGEAGDLKSELILGPGSFPVPPGTPAGAGNHVDLNQLTGARSIVRRMSTAPGARAGAEYVVRFVLDVGAGAGGGGVDYAGIELSHSAGGPIVFLGKPPGAGPANDGLIMMDVQGQGAVSTGVPADGQKFLQLRWVEDGAGAEQLTLTVFSTAGVQLGSATAVTEATFNQLTLRARRDLAFGGLIPAFDEFTVTEDTAPPPPSRVLTIESNPVSGVVVGVIPLDKSGLGGAATRFTRMFDHNTTVTLTAPANVGERLFQKWLRDGVVYSLNRTVGFALTADRTLTAVYGFPMDERFTDVGFEGANMRITWSSVGGRTYFVQATTDPAAGFTDISGAIVVPGTERTSSTFLDTDAVSFPRRFYRLRITAP